MMGKQRNDEDEVQIETPPEYAPLEPPVTVPSPQPDNPPEVPEKNEEN